MSLLQPVLDTVVRAVQPFMEDRVTFSRPASGPSSRDSSGGRVAGAGTDTTPASIPCVLELASTGRRLAEVQQLAEKPIKGTAYVMTIPSQYAGSVVDVDATCKATVAARGVDGQRVFQVHGPGRISGAIIQVLLSKTE